MLLGSCDAREHSIVHPGGAGELYLQFGLSVEVKDSQAMQNRAERAQRLFRREPIGEIIWLEGLSPD